MKWNIQNAGLAAFFSALNVHYFGRLVDFESIWQPFVLYVGVAVYAVVVVAFVKWSAPKVWRAIGLKNVPEDI